MHWILFIRKILLISSTCFEYQVLIFRRTYLYKQHMLPSLSIRVLVSCWYAAIGRTDITNMMHWILFIRKILLLSSTCFEYQVLIFRRTYLYKQHMVPSLSIRVLVSCWYAAIGRTDITNMMHWILFIRKILLLSSTCFEYQVLIFRRT